MMYVQWLQTNGTVLHLSTFGGEGRWNSRCNTLDPTEWTNDEGLWPWRREVSGRQRVVGLSRLGGWSPADADNHPPLPICSKCLARQAAEQQALTDWLTSHPQ
jgi:hypothetical protein